MKSEDLSVEDLIDTRYRSFSMYTIENRAIPSMIDGFKPVVRKSFYLGLNHAKSKPIKTSSISGLAPSNANYHHGSTSVESCITGMAQTFNNNMPIFNGHGSFGSRLIPEAAAPRYTFVELNKDIFKYFSDFDVSPNNSDPESPEPDFYLPIIPWVLVNGVSGIAVGFATNIIPRNIKDLANACISAIDGNPIVDDTKIKPCIPEFRGKIFKDDVNVWHAQGTFTKHSKTKISISELPPKFNRIKYVELLNKLQDDGKIVSFEEDCKKSKFGFHVVLPRSTTLTDEKLLKMFSLDMKLNENITVLDKHGKIRLYDSILPLIEDFTMVRLHYYQERYILLISRTEKLIHNLSEKARYIELILNGEIKYKGKTKNELVNQIEDKGFSKDRIDVLVGLPVFSFCQDEVESLLVKIKDQESLLKEYQSIDIKEQYKKELREILK